MRKKGNKKCLKSLHPLFCYITRGSVYEDVTIMIFIIFYWDLIKISCVCVCIQLDMNTNIDFFQVKKFQLFLLSVCRSQINISQYRLEETLDGNRTIT